MSQYKNIPQPSDQRNVSQVNILENYQYLATALGGAPAGVANGIIPVDHQASGDNVANPKDGFHNQCSYVAQTTPASLVNAVNSQTSNGIEYVKLDGNSNGQLRFLNNLMDQPITFLKAAVMFDNTGALVGNAFNVGSVTKNATGVYTINFTTNMPNANYMVFCQNGTSTNPPPTTPPATPTTTNYSVPTKAVASVKVMFQSAITGSYRDPEQMSVMIIGFF